MPEGRNTLRVGSAIAAIPIALGLLAPTVGDRGGSPTAPIPDGPAFNAGPVVPVTANAGLMNVYFGNLHSHTSYSDGVDTPDTAFRHARNRAHLDFLALTEHNHAQAGRIASDPSLYSGSSANSLISTATRLTEEGKFVALYGQEFSTIGSGNHINVLEVLRVIDVKNGSFDRLLSQWLPANPDSTGSPPVLLLNHPATSSSPNDKEYGRDDFGSDSEWVRQMGNRVSLMAMINGPSHEKEEFLAASAPAESEFFRYLSLGFRIAPTADQDNHFRTWGTATNARTAIVADQLTKPALLRAMRARHVYATEDKNLRLVCRVNGQLCGDRLSTVPALNAELQVELSIHDDDEPSANYEIDIFIGQIGEEPIREANETVAHVGNTSSPLRIEDIRYLGGSQYVFLRVRQMPETDNVDRAWLAPVWIDATLAPLPDTDPSPFVASRNSQIYHVSSLCKDAQAIKPVNRVVGAEAKRDRVRHANCPRQ